MPENSANQIAEPERNPEAAARFLIEGRSQAKREDVMRRYLHDPQWQEAIILALRLLDKDGGELLTRLCLDHARVPSRFEDLFHRDLLFALKAFSAGVILSPKAIAMLVEQFVPAFFEVTANRQLADYKLVGKPMFESLVSITDGSFRRSFISEVLSYLSHPDEMLRHRAVIALETVKATDRHTLQRLIDLMQHDASGLVRGDTAMALVRMGVSDERFIQLLRARLQEDEDGWVRGRLVWALSEVSATDPATVESLTDTLRNDEDKIVRGYAAGVLVEEGQDEAAIVAELLENVRRGKDHWAAVGWLRNMAEANNPTVVSVLLNVLQHDTATIVRWQAARSLASFAETNPTVLPVIFDVLRYDDDLDTFEAINEGGLASLLIGNEEAIAILLDRLRSESDKEDDSMRAAIVELLARVGVGKPVVVETLLSTLQHDSGWSARLEAIRALGRLGAGDARVLTALLHELLSEQQQGNVLDDVIYALAKVGYGVAAVVDAVLDVLAQALAALPTLAEGETRAWMIEHVHERNNQLRRACVYALGEADLMKTQMSGFG